VSAKRADVKEAKPKKPRASSATGKKVKRTKKGDGTDEETELGEDLPVITRPEDMFADIVDRFPEIGQLAEKLKRPVRVATMCSGTESPLLALALVSKATEAKHGHKLQVEHIFSSEIEPFKQAYIERNFQPPLLFRDVRELKDEKAHTAFGAMEEVPNQLHCADILIAGTSCVDYSGLNSEKKGLDAGGESGQTFFGMFEWVKKTRVPLVILENVSGAPGAGMVKNFATIKYHATWMRLDTKKYYLPHTRVRGYLLAGAAEFTSKETIESWVQKMRTFERSAGPCLEAFLLDEHDPRVAQARADRCTPKTRTKDAVPWEKCEVRYQRMRVEEGLGSKRPVTNWAFGTSSVTLPDFGWKDWASVQSERTLDTIDINYLRFAKMGHDADYKTSIWDLSQNVDRVNPTKMKFGTSPCLTPNLCAYVSNQGRPVIGVESLALQGIPIDELLLTRESEDNLCSLAGNAMSSTVVGSATLCALLVCAKDFDNHWKKTKFKAAPHKKAAPTWTLDVLGEKLLEERSLKLGAASAAGNAAQSSACRVIQEAQRATRCCVSEGPSGMAKSKILRCKSCGHTASSACSGKREHDYEELPAGERSPPSTFLKELHQLLPMQMKIGGMSGKHLEKARGGIPAHKNVELWNDWLKAASLIEKSEFNLVKVKRGKSWEVIYEDPAHGTKLFLHLGDGKAHWTVFGPCPSKRGVLRQQLEQPVARMEIDPASTRPLTAGKWKVRMPVEETGIEVDIQAHGAEVEKYEKTLGMDDSDVKRFSKLTVRLPAAAANGLETDVSGTYELLEKCLAPLGCLRKRTGDGEPMFLFVESTSVGNANCDGYIFAKDCRRLRFQEPRTSTILALDNEWRGDCKAEAQVVAGHVNGRWMPIPGAGLEDSSSSVAKVATISKPWKVDMQSSLPGDAQAMIHVSMPLASSSSAGPPSQSTAAAWNMTGAGQYVDILRAGISGSGTMSDGISNALGFLFPRLELPAAFTNWQVVTGGEVLVQRAAKDGSCCKVCAPAKPSLVWVMKGSKPSAEEDPYQAGKYERALKDRPQTFVVQSRTKAKGTGELRIAVGVTSLVSRAFAALPASLQQRSEEVKLEWRIVQQDAGISEHKQERQYDLKSNKHDKGSVQPVGFDANGASLREEQLRSLTWMLECEKSQVGFPVEEVCDGSLSGLGWRAEAKATVVQHVKGGVLADAVGYGKTAITFGLIDSSPIGKTVPQLPAHLEGKAIPVKATLIVVPKHLMAQWPDELEKFLGNKYKARVLSAPSDLSNLTIQEVQDTDILFVPFQAFRAQGYFDRFSEFGATHKLPAKGGRFFEEAHAKGVKNIENYVELLCNAKGGASAVLKAQKRDREALEITQKINASKSQAYAGSIPKRGQREVVQKKKAPKKEAVAPQKSKSASSKADRHGVVLPVKKTALKGSAKARRGQGNDPHGLDTDEVKKDWRQMRAPPLEMFYFARKVIDEYTYLDARDQPTVQAIKADASWVLSGTPPLASFDDVRGIAKYLGLYLGSPDPAQLTKKGKAKNTEMSASELLQEFLEVRSESWHGRRHLLAQRFLDRFVRQNLAEIDEIPCEYHIEEVKLSMAEKAAYLEMQAHVQALELRTKRRARSDREVRIRQILDGSKDADEALIKRCSWWKKGDTCSTIADRRKKELLACKAQIVEEVAQAQRFENECRRWVQKLPQFEDANMWMNNTKEHAHFKEYKQNVQLGVGDAVADEVLKKLQKEALKQAQADPRGLVAAKRQAQKLKDEEKEAAEPADSDDDEPKKPKGKKKKDKEDEIWKFPVVFPDDKKELEAKFKDMMWQCRAICTELNQLNKELAGHVRSQRFFKEMMDVLPANAPSASSSAGQKQAPRVCLGYALSSCCGHKGPTKEVKEAAARGHCIDKTCGVSLRPENIVSLTDIAARHDQDAGAHGSKLNRLVKMLHGIDKTERVLVFCQFPDLLKRVADVLAVNNVKAMRLQGTTAQQSSAVSEFGSKTTDTNRARVLLLEMDNESAAGTNLTAANHVVFVHPLHTDSLKNYEQGETQSVGRVRRYGQQKTVHIWRLLVDDTVDRTIFDSRQAEIAARKAQMRLQQEAAETAASTAETPAPGTPQQLRRLKRTVSTPPVPAATPAQELAAESKMGSDTRKRRRGAAEE
jgi:site-specific DNA-cytosine methylase